MFPSVVITGWNRGGLGYVYQYLKSAGLDVGLTFADAVSEEDVTKRASNSSKIEISSNLLPFLDLDCFAESSKWFALRDPLRVINSLIFAGRLHGERPSKLYDLMATQENFAAYSSDPVKLACYHVYVWLMSFFSDSSRAGNTFKVESEIIKLCSALNVNPKQEALASRKCNYSGCKQKITVANLPVEFQKTLESLSVEIGYKSKVWIPRASYPPFVSSRWHE